MQLILAQLRQSWGQLVSGEPAVAEGAYCNYAATSSDEILELCGEDPNYNLFKIVRTWTVIDWCTNTAITFNDANENGVQDAGEEDNIQIPKSSG